MSEWGGVSSHAISTLKAASPICVWMVPVSLKEITVGTHCSVSDDYMASQGAARLRLPFGKLWEGRSRMCMRDENGLMPYYQICNLGDDASANCCIPV